MRKTKEIHFNIADVQSVYQQIIDLQSRLAKLAVLLEWSLKINAAGSFLRKNVYDETEQPQKPKAIGDVLKNKFDDVSWLQKVSEKDVARLEYTDFDVMHFSFFSAVGANFNLKTLELAILCCVWAFSRLRGYCFLSKEKMATLVRTTPQSLYQHLGRLKKRGLIEQLPNTLGRVTLLRLSPEALDYTNYIKSKIDERNKQNRKPSKNNKY